MPVVREIVTRLGVQADHAAIGKFESAFKRLKEEVMGLGFAAIAAAGAAGLFAMARSVARAGDAAAKGARQIGISTQSYQELAYAAERAGTNIQQVGSGLGVLQKNLRDAAKGVGPAAEQFKALGIKIRGADGSLRSADSMLAELADKFKTMPDGPAKTAAAMTLFGGAGRQMLPMLQQGAEGLDRMRVRAHELGIVLNESEIAQGTRFQEGMQDVQASLTGIKNTIGMSVLPAISKFLEKLVKWFTLNREIISERIEKVLEFLSEFFLTITNYVGMAAQAVWSLIEALGGIDTAIIGLQAFFGMMIAIKLFATIKQLILVFKALGAVLHWTALKALLLQGSLFIIPALIGAAVIVAVVLIVKHWKRISAWVSGAWKVVVRNLRSAWDWFTGILGSAAEWVGNLFMPLFNGISAAFDWIIGKLTWVYDKVAGLVSSITTAVREVGEALGLVDTESETLGKRQQASFDRLDAANKARLLARAREAIARGGYQNITAEKLAANMAQREANRAAAGANVSQSVGAINVSVNGSTNMGPQDIARATQRGVQNALDPAVRDLASATAGSAR